MAHYALVEKNTVKSVVVIEDDQIENYELLPSMTAIKTSYNTRGGVHYDPDTGNPSADQSKALRKNYAGVGYQYDKDLDAFIPPQPFPSWTLNQTSFLWEAPVAMPNDDKMYDWNEANQSWEEVAT